MTPEELAARYGFPRTYTEPEATAYIAGFDAARAALATPAPLDGLP